MPRNCCVPECKSNYNSTLKCNGSYVSVFLFPKDDILRQKWIAAIPRKNWTPSKNSVVCSKHFRTSEIVRYENGISPDGTQCSIVKRCPKLVENAVPTVFPNLPAYLSKPEVVQRKHPEERRQKAIENHARLVLTFEQSDLIPNFSNLKSHYSEKLQLADCWNVTFKDSKMFFL